MTAAMVLMAHVISAQVPAPGVIVGNVKDQHGATLPGVAIVIDAREAASGPAVRKAATVSDSAGRFRLDQMPQGRYRLTATRPGFADLVTEPVIVAPGETVSLDLIMLVAGVQDAVTVVGTHIRDVETVGVAPLVITREEIVRGGFTRVEEVLRTLPQNFGGGAREDTLVQQTTGNDRTLQGNFDKGAGVNLRGLGADATLVLVDGRRLAPSGQAGLFTDISNIPMGAVERIEVLTDGASALYGSDAIGGVVNIVLRKDDRGFETLARGSAGVGGNQEYQFSQAYGRAWRSGRVNVTYDFYKRGELVATERPFAANSDQRPHGGDDFSANSGFPGTIFIGTRTWALPANQDGRNVNASALTEGTVNWRNTNENLWMLPRQRRHGATLAVSQTIGPRVTASTRLLVNRRRGNGLSRWGEVLTVPSTNPFYINPTGARTPITVRYDMTNDFGRPLSENEADVISNVTGVEVAVWRRWRVDATVSYARQRSGSENLNVNRPELTLALADSNPLTAFNPFGDQGANNPDTMNRIRATSYSDTTSEATVGAVLADGPLMRAPGGDVRMAVGADYRDYSLRSVNGQRHLSTPTTSVRFGRQVHSQFVELRVPLVGTANRRSGLHELVVAASGRRENYTDYGASTVPRLSATYAPFSSVRIGASWSKSFRAPDLPALNETNNSASISNLPDPLSPTGNSSIVLWNGNNAGLKAETARHTTVSLDVAVPRISNLRVGANYYDIDYVNRLQTPFAGAAAADILAKPEFSTFITRTPTAEYRERVCRNDTRPSANLQACLTTPVAAIVDLRMANTAKVATNGLDLRATHAMATGIGNIAYGMTAAYIFNFKHAIVDASQLVSRLNQKYRPIDFRARAHVTWERSAWHTTVFVNYTDDYQDTTSTGTRPIASFTTADLDVGYQPTSGVLSGLGMSLHVQNLFNADPPFVNTALGYDVTNADPYGRVAQLLIRKRW